jgi:sec-independent protein translocase protein TatB
MFDVGLTELMVIAVVALVVIGPERLPKVARTAGLLLGRLQRYVGDVKADINREMQLDELKKLQQQVATEVSSVEASVNHEIREIEGAVEKSVALDADIAVPSAPTSAATAPDVAPAPSLAATGQATETKT